METVFESTDTRGNKAMDEDTIVRAMQLKTVLEAFRDTNAGKPLQICLVLTFANCLHFRRVVCTNKHSIGIGYDDKIDKLVLVS